MAKQFRHSEHQKEAWLSIKPNYLVVLIIIQFIITNSVFAQNHPNPPQRHTNNYPQSQNQHNRNTYPHNYPQTNPHPVQPPTPIPQTPPPAPVPPPPPPPIRQDFISGNMYMNLGQIIKNGINLTAEAGAMAEKSSLEVKQLDFRAAASEIFTNCKSNRFK